MKNQRTVNYQCRKEIYQTVLFLLITFQTWIIILIDLKTVWIKYIRLYFYNEQKYFK